MSMTPIFLPVTLATASVLALIYIGLSLRVIQGRFKYRVSLGDGGNADMQNRIRTHGNFIEYVPLLLLFLALFELAGVEKSVLGWCGGALVMFRILHVVGIPQRSPNIYRFLGTVGTFTLIISASIYGLMQVFG